jgi:hypothetical protein
MRQQNCSALDAVVNGWTDWTDRTHRRKEQWDRADDPRLTARVLENGPEESSLFEGPLGAVYPQLIE